MQVQLKAPFPFDQAPCFAEIYAEGPGAREQRYRDPAWRARALDELTGILKLGAIYPFQQV